MYQIDIRIINEKQTNEINVSIRGEDLKVLNNHVKDLIIFECKSFNESGKLFATVTKYYDDDGIYDCLDGFAYEVLIQGDYAMFKIV